MKAFLVTCFLTFSVYAMAEEIEPWVWQSDQIIPTQIGEVSDYSPYNRLEDWDLVHRLFPETNEVWGVNYLDPTDRDLIGMIVPTGMNVPYSYKILQIDLIKYRGPEFWPNETVGQGFHKEKRARYGPLWTIRGLEGLLACFPELTFLSAATDYGLPSGPGLGFSLRLQW